VFFLPVIVAGGFLRGLSCRCFCTVLFIASVQRFLCFVMLFILIKLFFAFSKKKINTGQGWPVSPGARIGPGSGPIFPSHIQTGLFSPAVKSPLPDWSRPGRPF